MGEDLPRATAAKCQGSPHFRLRLFMAGNEPNSAKARMVLSRLCEQYLWGRYELQLIDVLEDYPAALANQVMAVPTLFVETPTRRTVLVGSLNDEAKLLLAFGIFNAEVRS